MRKFVAFCMMALATTQFVVAADIKSGLQVDDYPAAFNVTDITGPSAGVSGVTHPQGERIV